MPPGYDAFMADYPAGFANNEAKIRAAYLEQRPPDLVLRAGLVAWKASDAWQRGVVHNAENWLAQRLFEKPPPPPPRVTAARTAKPTPHDNAVNGLRNLRRNLGMAPRDLNGAAIGEDDADAGHVRGSIPVTAYHVARPEPE
jgi:hypothetical protein